MNSTVSIRERLIFSGWIAGLFAALTLVWILTQPLQERCLLRKINECLTLAGDQRRLAAAAPFLAGSPPGFWYSFSGSGDRLFVFGILRDGIFIPCGARVGQSDTVEEIIPLGFNAVRSLQTVPQEVLRMYIRRIEAAAVGSRS
jgi:hypothetical protein